MGVEGRWWRVRVWRGGEGDVAVRARSGRVRVRVRRADRGVSVRYMVKGVVVFVEGKGDSEDGEDIGKGREGLAEGGFSLRLSSGPFV